MEFILPEPIRIFPDFPEYFPSVQSSLLLLPTRTVQNLHVKQPHMFGNESHRIVRLFSYKFNLDDDFNPLA